MVARFLYMCFRLSPVSCVFFFNDTATTEIYTLSLHDALPISMGGFAAFPSPETSSEARATMARCPRRVQRDSLGAAHRRSLARSARPLSALSNLPSPLPAVDRKSVV